MEWYLHTLPLHTSHPSVSRAVIMEEFQQGVLYYQALVANGLIEGEPGNVQGVDPRLGREEYVETDYEYEKSDEEMEEVWDIEEVPSEPHSSEIIQDHPAAP